MTTNLLPLRPAITVRACARRHEPNKKTSSNWWTPLFGISNDPDYIESNTEVDGKKENEFGANKELRAKFAPGCFTEDKAKLLRKLTSDTSSYHDVMYHSAIASRLATDFKGKCKVVL